MKIINSETLKHITVEVTPDIYDRIFNMERQVDFIPVNVILESWGIYINESREYSDLPPIDWEILNAADLVSFTYPVQK